MDSVQNGSWRCKPSDKNDEQGNEHRGPSAAEAGRTSATGRSIPIDEAVVERGALQIAGIERALASHAASVADGSAMGVALVESVAGTIELLVSVPKRLRDRGKLRAECLTHRRKIQAARRTQ